MADLHHGKKMSEEYLHKITRASARQRISALLFLEENIDLLKIKREYVLYSQQIKNINQENITLGISKSFFIFDDNSGEIIGMDYSKLKPSKDSPLLIQVDIKSFLQNIEKSMGDPIEKSPRFKTDLFWDFWDTLKNLKEVN